VLPGITDTVPQINALMAAGREAGARFVYPSVLRLYADPRERFLPLVRQHFPELAPRYEAAYGRGRDAPRAYVEALNRRFRRIARRFGIPETDGEREQPATRAAVRQLNLWGQQTRNAER
jgi:DNA repair photolyase